jgi:phage-related minor tail protein
MARTETLTEQVEALEAAMGQAAGMAAAFEGELARMRETMVFTGREVGSLSSGIGGGLRRAFDGLALDGMRLGDALKTVARSIADTVYDIALRPVQSAVGGAIAQGLVGAITPFAKGGVVSGATAFPMKGGTGLMGEAGPEAIMPLARGPDGSLGVRGGGRPINVVINVATQDVEGFRRSQSQIAAEASRAIARGQRNR